MGAGRQAVAYGAGTLGRMLAQELAQNRDLGYRLVGFIDDDAARVGDSVLGVPVVGGLPHLESLIADGAGAVILATRKLPKDVVRRLQDLCTDAGIPLLEFLCVLRDVPTLGVVHAAADERSASLAGPAPAAAVSDERVPLIRHVEVPAAERARPGSWAVPKA
jgi:FlaA1/EpsC-like NDP-sugar epimerase